MTITQICLLIYICTFVCSFGGMNLYVWDAFSKLRKKGIIIPREDLLPDLWVVLVSLCPIVNLLVIITIAKNYDTYVNKVIELGEKYYERI